MEEVTAGDILTEDVDVQETKTEENEENANEKL